MAVYIYTHDFSPLLFPFFFFYPFRRWFYDSVASFARPTLHKHIHTHVYKDKLNGHAWWKAKSFPWWNFLSLISEQLDAVRLISSRTPKTDTWNEFSTERTNALLNRCLKGCASLFHPLPFSLPPIPIESITGNKPFLFNFLIEFPADIDETMGWFKKFFLFLFFFYDKSFCFRYSILRLINIFFLCLFWGEKCIARKWEIGN